MWSDIAETAYRNGDQTLMYRNEAMDATHLAEFFQVEGVVADYDITLGNLVGMSYLLLRLSLFPFGKEKQER